MPVHELTSYRTISKWRVQVDVEQLHEVWRMDAFSTQAGRSDMLSWCPNATNVSHSSIPVLAKSEQGTVLLQNPWKYHLSVLRIQCFGIQAFRSERLLVVTCNLTKYGGAGVDKHPSAVAKAVLFD
jgi:hypothetical protein